MKEDSQHFFLCLVLPSSSFLEISFYVRSYICKSYETTKWKILLRISLVLYWEKNKTYKLKRFIPSQRNLTLLFDVNIYRWYKKDENCFPVSYILQPVTTWIPEYFNDQNPSLRQEAQKQWQCDYNAMREFLQQAAKEVFSENPEIWRKFVRSGKILPHFVGLLRCQEPIRRRFHLPYNTLVSTLSRVDL